MAIGQNHISPGVYTNIIDLSYYLQEVPGTTGFIPFFSRKGPDNILTKVAGQPQYKILYDTPNMNDYGKTYGQGPYIAWNHLSISGNLYALRLLPEDALFSNLFIIYNTDATGSIEVSYRTDVNQLKNDNQKQAYIDAESVGTKKALMMFYPIGRGDIYNDYGIVIQQHSNTYLKDQGVYTIQIWQTSQTMPEDNLIEQFDISFDDTAVDEAGDSLFITDVVNRFSNNIRCYVDKNEDSNNLNAWKKSGIPMLIPDPNLTTGYQEYPPGSGITISSIAVHLAEGTEGSLVEIDIETGRRKVNTVVATRLLTQAYMGLIDELVLDLDNIYFSIVYDAGYPNEVKKWGIKFLVSEMRRDCFAFCDNGDNTNVQDSIDTRELSNNMDTFYLGLFEPFNKVYDAFTGKKVWVSPIYHLATLVPQNDALYAIWYPTAGLNRASISSIEELRFNPKLTDRDSMYLAQLNPICQFTTGYTVWGNLTSQTRPSKLSNISTVRTVLYIKRALEQFCKWYVFDFNDAETHTTIASRIAGFLQKMQDSRALEGYSVEVGATDYEKKQKICHVNVILVPTGVIERINLNLYIQ